MSEQTSVETLHKHARKGWIWGGIDQFAQRGLTMIVSLVLARLLEPAAFGLIASVAIFLNITQQIIDGGIAQRVIQKPELKNEDYLALFWCNGLVSLICCGLLIIFSGVIARFYGNPQLQLIVVALAGIVFLMNVGRVQETRLTRELRFRTSSLIKIGSVVAGCLSGLIMAFTGFGVWALLGQQAVMALARALALWILVPWRPSGKVSLAAIRDLYAYGLPVLLSMSARSFASQLINVLIAKRVSVVALGFYDRGRIIPQNLGFSLANIFGRTNFPVLSRLQHDGSAFRDTYLRFFQNSTSIFFMLMTGLAVCAHDLIQIVLGIKWLPSVWFLQANCAAFALFIVFTTNSELLRSKGLTRIFFKYNSSFAVLQVLGVVAGMPWGAKGMVLGDVLARGLICIPLMMAVSKISLVTVRCQLRALLWPLAAAAAVAAGLTLVKLINLPLIPRFILSGIVGAGMMGLYWYTDGFKKVPFGATNQESSK